MKPLEWMRAIRRAGVPGAALAVLDSLALRMRRDGTGFASMQQLADDTGVHRATVWRHVQWARSTGWLEQTRRGHRVNDKTAIASEYALTEPNVAPAQHWDGEPTLQQTDPTLQSADPMLHQCNTQRSSPRGPQIISAAPSAPATPSHANGHPQSPMNVDLKKITKRVDGRVDVEAERQRQTAALAAWQRQQETHD